MEIRLPIYDIVITMDDEPAGRGRSGDIGTNFPKDADPDQRIMVEGMERLILAHACSGVDVSAPAYIEGIQAAVEHVLLSS